MKWQLDRDVLDLRRRFEKCTAEGARLKLDVDQAQVCFHVVMFFVILKGVIESAESLIGKLHDERVRWGHQVATLTQELGVLPNQALLASAFITYLAKHSEDGRKERLNSWKAIAKIEDFEFRKFMASETEQLRWKTEVGGMFVLCFSLAGSSG